jgi:hypothetical protein
MGVRPRLNSEEFELEQLLCRNVPPPAAGSAGRRTQQLMTRQCNVSQLRHRQHAMLTLPHLNAPRAMQGQAKAGGPPDALCPSPSKSD